MFLCVICSKSNNMDNSHAAQLVRLVASEKVPQNYTPVPASVSAPTCDIIITYRFNSSQSNTASLASHIREKYKTEIAKLTCSPFTIVDYLTIRTPMTMLPYE